MCSDLNRSGSADSRSPGVSVSRWVNEPLPDVRGLLCSRDVARLTRRPRWVVVGLALVGKFPRRKRFHGRVVGWCRTEVLEWMARGMVVEEPREPAFRCARRRPRQVCLPLECVGACSHSPALRKRRSAVRLEGG